MLKKLFVALVVVVAALLVFATTRPNSFRVERSAMIKAPPETILALVNDFHQWNSWSPWEKLDPTMQRSFTGAPSGKGAVYSWSGNSKAGAGHMEILETTPTKTSIQLDFLKPFKSNNVVDFTAIPQGDSTNVTWAMHGPSPYVSKVMSIFMNMDTMIGKDFESGLAAMKNVAEGRATTTATAISRSRLFRG